MSEKLLPYEKAARLIRLVAWLQLIAIFGIMAAIAIPMIFERNLPGPQFIFALLLILLPVFQLYLGSAIKDHKPWGRAVGIALGMIFLFGFPIGTIVGSFIIWYLVRGWDSPPSSKDDRPWNLL